MEFPNSKLSFAEASAARVNRSIGTEHLEVNPDQPHRYQIGRGKGFDGCGVCGGSREIPVHIEPILGWPE